VAKVSELKERARILEQQGDLAKARTIYEHILKHLEGTPALKAELPMYVKVGDLSLKLGDPAGAVAMYEQAAGHYATAGSARSIGALAEKIRRADPTRDDAAVGLGQALLAHGHAGAAAEVAIRYARRVERDDVVAILEEIEHDAEDAGSRARVEGALSMLAGPTPAEPAPEPEPEPEREPEPEPEPEAAAPEPEPEPEPATPPPEPAAPEPTRWEAAEPEPVKAAEPRHVWEEPESEPPPEEPEGPRIDLPLLTFGSEVPPAEAAPAESKADDGLLIRHGVEEPAVSESPPPPPEPEPEVLVVPPADVTAEREVFVSPKSVDEVVADAMAAAPPVEPPASTAEAPPRQPEPEPSAAPVEAAPAAPPEPEPSPPKWRGWPDESHVLVREPRAAKKEKREGLIAAGIALVVVVIVGAVAWAVGLLPFGRGEASDGQPGDQVAVAESLTPPVDSTVPADSAAPPADTTQFGPIGFNAVTNRPAGAAQGADTAGADSAVADTVLPPAVVPPPDVVTTPVQPAPALPRIVVPPGHAIADEIVAIPGLEVVSVAETRVSGVVGIRVIQRAEDGEIAIVAVLADFGADTVGIGRVTVRTEGDSAIGDVRVGRYLVEARSTLPSDVLAGLLGRLIRARPVN